MVSKFARYLETPTTLRYGTSGPNNSSLFSGGRNESLYITVVTRYDYSRLDLQAESTFDLLKVFHFKFFHNSTKGSSKLFRSFNKMQIINMYILPDCFNLFNDLFNLTEYSSLDYVLQAIKILLGFSYKYHYLMIHINMR